jgi:F0F1-type ATP synthase alpha subunit
MQQEALKKLLSSVDSAITKIKSDVLAPKKAGIVRSAKDGIIEIENISGLRMGEVVVIEDKNMAEAMKSLFDLAYSEAKRLEGSKSK